MNGKMLVITFCHSFKNKMNYDQNYCGISYNSERLRRRAFAGKCFRCGSADHIQSSCKYPRKVVCSRSNSTGHVQTACNKPTARSAQPEQPAQQAIEYQDSSWADAVASPAAQSNYIGPARTEWTSSNRPTPEAPM